MIALALVSLLLPAGAAWALLRWVDPVSGRDVPGLVMRAGLAVLLGTGAGALVAYASLAVGVPLGHGYAAVEAVLLAASAAALWIAAARRGHSAEPSLPAPPEAWRGLEVVAPLVAGAGFLLVAGAVALYGWRAPHGDWDAWAIWNQHARFLFRGGAAWRVGLSPDLAWSMPDYPPLVPAAVARVWAYSGETQFGPALVGTAFTLSGIAVVFGAVARLRGVVAGACAALLMAATEEWIVWGAAQGADVPLAALVAGACAALLVADLPGRNRGGLVAIAGALLALAGLSKDDGLVFAVLIGTWCLVRSGRAGARTSALSLAAGAALPFAAWAHFRFLAAPGLGSVIGGGGGFADYLSRLVDPARWSLILQKVPGHLPGGHGRVALYALVAAALLGSRPRGMGRSPVLIPLLASYGAFLLVYAITPKDLGYHITTSAPRILLQPWPALIMALFAAGEGRRAGAPTTAQRGLTLATP